MTDIPATSESPVAKKIVNYLPGTFVFLGAGKNAFLKPLDGKPSTTIITGPVVHFDPTSMVFETEETIYVPLRKEEA